MQHLPRTRDSVARCARRRSGEPSGGDGAPQAAAATRGRPGGLAQLPALAGGPHVLGAVHRERPVPRPRARLVRTAARRAGRRLVMTARHAPGRPHRSAGRSRSAARRTAPPVLDARVGWAPGTRNRGPPPHPWAPPLRVCPGAVADWGAGRRRRLVLPPWPTPSLIGSKGAAAPTPPDAAPTTPRLQAERKRPGVRRAVTKGLPDSVRVAQSAMALRRNRGARQARVACSKAYARRISVGSLQAVPMKLTLTGRSWSNPAGTVTMG